MADVERRSPQRLWVMPVAVPRLGDAGLTVRGAEDADAEVIAGYLGDPAMLSGTWLPVDGPPPSPLSWSVWFVRELQLGWSPLGGRYGGGLVVDAEGDRCVGLLHVLPVGPRAVELIYGVAPHRRGRGIATEVTRQTTEWALAGGFTRVELEIPPTNLASQRVAVKCGFTRTGRVVHTSPLTGESFDVIQMRRRS